MKESKHIKILLADDHKLIRDGIKAYLEDEPDLEIIEEADNGQEALQLLFDRDIDVAILDINMPVLTGIQVAEEIQSSGKDIKIIALTMLNETQHIRQMLRAGAIGYLLKSCSREELINGLKTVAQGKSYFSKEVTQSVMLAMSGRFKSKQNILHQEIPLTNREKEILQLITWQYSNQEIAQKLYISVRTVEAHKRNLIEKTGSKNIVGLVLYAIEKGFIKNLEPK